MKGEYGWLTIEHIALGMSFFRERGMQNPSSYRPRIAFIDPYFSSMWVRNLIKDFLPDDKSWIFTDGYISLYNGGRVAKKKWVEDVDTLYICHNINNCHWIALEVDIPKKKISIYDSIYSAYDEAEVFQNCHAYACMIPLLIKQLAPANQNNKYSVAAFTLYRRKQLPQNVQSGDCRLYTLKYIECPALDRGFDGLSDATIGDIRQKYVADIHAENPDDGFMFSDPNPRVAEGS